MKKARPVRSVAPFALLGLVGLQASLSAPPAAAAIYRWDNGELITEKNAEPNAWLSGMNLSYADLVGAQLPGARLTSTNLSNAHLMGADLRDATLSHATLTGADFTEAVITNASLAWRTRLTAEQLYSTASYQAGDLRGIDLFNLGISMGGWNFTGKNLAGADFGQTDLTGADYAGADLTDARFQNATLTDANFSRATITGASFRWARGFTVQQLYSTASYQTRDLRGVDLGNHNLSGGDFAGQNLTDASFSQATLSNADFSGAIITGALFKSAKGLSAQQFYSTASYQTGELSGISMYRNHLNGWNFAGKNLTEANFSQATLSNVGFGGANLTQAVFWDASLTAVDFRGANLHGADFEKTTLSGADFGGAVVTGARFPGASGFSAEQLYTTASYRTGDLRGIRLYRMDLTGANFAEKNLIDTSFSQITLTDADFSGAMITGASFGRTTGFMSEQFYSTVDYATGNLRGLGLVENDLTGWDFAGKNLANASFRSSRLVDADFTGAVVTGADFSYTTSRGFTAAQLYSTANYLSGDLTEVDLRRNDLSGWDFAEKNLPGASFSAATLTGADFTGSNLSRVSFKSATLTDAEFTGAVVTGADFSYPRSGALAAEQLYSTASYENGDLSGMGFERGELSGWSFAGKNLAGTVFWAAELVGTDLGGANLTSAYFADADLTDANLSGANLMNAGFFGEQPGVPGLPGGATMTDADLSLSDLRGAFLALTSTGSTEGAILPDGRIQGLALDAGERLVVRDYNGSPWWDAEGAIPITVESAMSLDPAAVLRMVFEDGDWGSTISFEPGIGVWLGGSLELLFAEGTHPADLIGTTFDLFDWDGAVRSGQFDHIVPAPGTVWDTSRLYTTGEVTLVPEPSALMLLGIAAVLLLVGTVRFGRGSATIA